MEERKIKCIICGNLIQNGYGNNPNPVVDYGRCCDDCNKKYVVPARIKAYNKSKLHKK